MAEVSYIRRITKQGRVTIPAEIRRALGLEAKSRVVFDLRGEHVVISAAETLRSVFGAVAPLARPEDFRVLCDQALEDKVSSEPIL